MSLLLECEISHRHDKRLTARLRYAKLRHQAAVEDVDYRTIRGLDRALFQKLAGGAWIEAHDNLIFAARLAWARVGWRRRWGTKPAGTTSLCFISACQSCSPNWRWRVLTAGIDG